MFYRKKPVVIEAFKLDLSDAAAARPEWFSDAVGKGVVRLIDLGGAHPFARIETLEGTVSAAEGDWIIKGVKDELYPCRDDIFQATYEPATRFDPAAFGTRG